MIVGILWLGVPFAVLPLIAAVVGVSFGSRASVLFALAIPAAAYASYVSFVRVVERRRPEELAGDGAVRQLAIGFVIGSALAAQGCTR